MLDSHFTREQLAKVFLDNKKNMTVKLQPKGETRDNDILLMILYGFKALRGADSVKVGPVKASLINSGVTADRVDRVAEPYRKRGYLHKGGMGPGGMYTITNTGVETAQKLIEDLLKQ